MLSRNTVLVTVTYGNRWVFLRECINSALHEGINSVIVIDNNSKENINNLCAENFSSNVYVFKQTHNLGSAGGYKLGVQKAIEKNFDYILLLDDDNKIPKDSYKKLKASYDEYVEKYSAKKCAFAVSAYRPMHEPEIASGSKLLKYYAFSQSFIGFHFLDLPLKVFKRLPCISKVISTGKPNKYVELKKAVWSGLFFHKDLIKNIGLPLEELIVYSDDIEFTQRVIKHGGKIVLNTEAPLDEMDKSWNVGNNVSNSFDNYLLAESDFRVYYVIRNQTYIEKHKMKCGFIWAINKNIYLLLLFIRAINLSKLKRWQLIKSAVGDGVQSRLGVNIKFPLI